MKNIFFSVLAIAMLATTAVVAGDKKTAIHDKKTTLTCTENCAQAKLCQDDKICPAMEACICK